VCPQPDRVVDRARAARDRRVGGVSGVREDSVAVLPRESPRFRERGDRVGTGAGTGNRSAVWRDTGCSLWMASILYRFWIDQFAVATAMVVLDAEDEQAVDCTQQGRAGHVGHRARALSMGNVDWPVLRQLLPLLHGHVATVLPGAWAGLLHDRNGENRRRVF